MSELILDRRAVLSRILQDRDGALIVTGLGSPVCVCRASMNGRRTFISGLAWAWPVSPTGPGAGAAGQAGVGGDRRWRDVDGRRLATIATKAPRNLSIMVLDNEHVETGAGDAHRSRRRFGWHGGGGGFQRTLTVREDGDVETLARAFKEGGFPLFATVKVKADCC